MRFFRNAFILCALFSVLSLANAYAYDRGEYRGGEEHQYNHNNYYRGRGDYNYGHGYQRGNYYHGNVNIEGNNQNQNPTYVVPYQEPDQEANWNYFQEQPPQ